MTEGHGTLGLSLEIVQPGPGSSHFHFVTCDLSVHHPPVFSQLAELPGGDRLEFLASWPADLSSFECVTDRAIVLACYCHSLLVSSRSWEVMLLSAHLEK